MSTEQEKKSVWIIEDHSGLRLTISSVIDDDSRFACKGAFDTCEKALATLTENKLPYPDAILIDLGLPGMDGIEGIQRIKEITPSTEILVFTVFDDNERLFDAICAGASGYLLKSSGTRQIPDAIDEILGGGAPMNSRLARRILDRFSKTQPKRQDYGLSQREQEVLQLMIEGLIKKEIGDQLSISIHTVGNHIRKIYTKLQVNTMQGAVAKALQEQLIPPKQANPE